MDHIRSRFVEGSLVSSSRCLHRLKPYFHSCNVKIAKNNFYESMQTKNCPNSLNELSSKTIADSNKDEYVDKKDDSQACSYISGYPIIDDLLNQIIEFIFRDYVDHWYYVISNDEIFLTHLKKCLRFALGRLCQQLKNVDMTSYMTKDLVEEFVNHLKIYKATLGREKRSQNGTNSWRDKGYVDMADDVDDLPINGVSPSMKSSTSEPSFDKFLSTTLPAQQHQKARCSSSGGHNYAPPCTSSPCSSTSPIDNDIYCSDEKAEDLRMYFQVESEFENGTKKHDLVCTDKEYQKSYLLVFAEIVLYILIPNEEYTRPVKTLLTEILVNVVLMPVLEMFSDPDYINQMIIWLFANYGVTSDQFLDVMRFNGSLIELEAVKEIVVQEMGQERSKDTGGTDDTEIKQRLQSLTYLKRLIDSRCKRLSQGCSYEYQNKLKTLPAQQTEQFLNVKFEFILDHTLSLDYFLNYLTAIHCQNYMYFYLTIESFRSLAKQHIPPDTVTLAHQNPSNQPINIKLVRNEAQKILDQYLSEKAPHYIRLNQAHVKVLRSKIKNEIPNPTWFDDLQYEILDMFLKSNGLFENFKHSPLFVKMLAEMDLLPDARDSSETSSIHEGDALSMPKITSFNSLKSSPIDPKVGESSEDRLDRNALSEGKSTTSKGQPNFIGAVTNIINNKHYELSHNLLKRALEIEYRLDAHVTHIVVSRESDRTYAMYAITVTREPYHSSNATTDSNPSKSGAGVLGKGTKSSYSMESWCVYRRYSEFHDFHMNLRERYADVAELRFPPKKPFGNMTKDFLEKRLKTLDSYLKALLAPEFLKTHKGLKELMEQFLEPGSYEKWNGQIARTMDTFVNPLKSSVRFVGSVVKTVPENIADGVIKVSDTMIDGMGKLFSLAQIIPGFKFTDTIIAESLTKASLADIEDVDNIAFKILILLMDEIFDLKTRNQWLRRRLMVIMRQVVQVAYGGTMNKKILEQVEWLTLPEQVASFLKKFKDSFWPNSLLAGRAAPRSQSQKARTKVLALVKIFAAIPDEIRTVVGSETTKEGVKITFDMLQHKSYNKRYLYAILERFCPLIFPGGPGIKIVKIVRDRFLSSTRSSSHSLQRGPKVILPPNATLAPSPSQVNHTFQSFHDIRPLTRSDPDHDDHRTTGRSDRDNTLPAHKQAKNYDSISLNECPVSSYGQNGGEDKTPVNHSKAYIKSHKRTSSTPLGKNVINFKKHG